MVRSDIVFLHAPSVYDFRKKTILYGPVSDVIPSSPVFEMYPIGFMTISSHLEAAGFRTRIVNLAVQMLQSKRFDVEERIRTLEADVFAIDLHWMPHVHGATEIAKIVKKHHPDSKIEFGGLTSSYFWEELIQMPEIDLIMRGDTTEEPTVRMMRALQDGKDLSEVPNLVWKDAGGKVRNNGVTYSADDLDDIRFDYGTMIKNTIRYMDVKGALPWAGWDKLPLTSVFSVRGCSMNCAECGGSGYANGKVVCRNAPAYRSPEKLAEDMEMIQSYLDTPIFIVGDLRQHSDGYAERFLKAVKERGIKNHAVIELFGGAGREYFSKLDKAFDGGWSIEFSPDSHDEAVRSALGKKYSNSCIERTIEAAFEKGCKRMDLFYMTGLPFQTRESAIDSAKASKKLWELVKKEDDLFIYNAPFAPFVDPGSKAFEEPEKWGYKFFARTLAEHKALLENPSWKQVLSYETKWMDRNTIAETSYDAAIELAAMAFECSRTSAETFEERKETIEAARRLMHEVDEVTAYPDKQKREGRLLEMKEELDMRSIVCDKNDLYWEAGSVWRNSPRIVLGLIRSRNRRNG
ncbi:MAG: TIGR04190 family B12-binding domain/radical SAM domain protein [Candidatus Methanoplasma sp.]|nr:TIGR04190 family B12-binding domain/radical SAM domain protein [Candidatus Methanoplasma sp.]